MSKNTLTPQQDIITRQFFVLVGQDNSQLTPREMGTLRGLCLDLLNYEVIDGKFITPDTSGFSRKHPFGTPPSAVEVGECEWEKDYMEALKQGGKDARANHKDSITPGTSVKAKNTKVRKALFSKDVQ